jgi:hypothetical protein
MDLISTLDMIQHVLNLNLTLYSAMRRYTGLTNVLSLRCFRRNRRPGWMRLRSCAVNLLAFCCCRSVVYRRAPGPGFAKGRPLYPAPRTGSEFIPSLILKPARRTMRAALTHTKAQWGSADRFGLYASFFVRRLLSRCPSPVPQPREMPPENKGCGRQTEQGYGHTQWPSYSTSWPSCSTDQGNRSTG